MQQIALMQTEHYSITGSYYGTASCTPSAAGTAAINTILFDVEEGDEIVIDEDRYEFCVQHEKEDDVVVGFLIQACNTQKDCPKIYTLNSKGANNF